MKYIFVFGTIVLIVAATYLYNYRQQMSRGTTEQEKSHVAAITDAAIFKEDSEQLPYRLFSPKVTKNEKLPLILYLHGAGGREVNNLNQLENIVHYVTNDDFQEKHTSFVLIPQCPRGHQWVDIPNDKSPYQNYNQDITPEGLYQKLTVKLLDELSLKHNIDTNRIYLIGFSMGATGAWDILTRHPEKFAAAVILSGRSDPSKAEKIRSIPIWQFHGRFDRVSPISNSQKMVDQLKLFDGKIIFQKLFWGHGIPQISLKEKKLFPWLFAQNKTSQQE